MAWGVMNAWDRMDRRYGESSGLWAWELTQDCIADGVQTTDVSDRAKPSYLIS